MAFNQNTINDVPSDDPALVQANALQRRVLDCERILAGASAFAQERWDSDAGSFSDVVERSGRHLVNTATALIVLARYPKLFDTASLPAYSQLDSREVVGKLGSLAK